MTQVAETLQSHLTFLGIKDVEARHNLTPRQYEEYILAEDENRRSSLGAVSILTGKFTGRSPKDRYIVKENRTSLHIDWGEINQGISADVFHALKSNILDYLHGKTIYVQDGIAGADSRYSLNVRVIAEKAYSALFSYNMFRRIQEDVDFETDWNIYCAPGYKANPEEHEGLKNENFAIINFDSNEIIIGGTGYTGEIKKGIFSVLNYVLPKERGVLSMHCSANVDKNGENPAVFFGLSGTGKTTLSADENRCLIGDDEHGWSPHGIFNFEGGCYAKTINLSPEGEPQIYAAIKPGAILENVDYYEGTQEVNFAGKSITENTRVSYPLYHIEGVKEDSKSGHPKNIFFLTCDAFGVLPPVSQLNKEQAMKYFMMGYTAKIAGTEEGITEPVATFSACFGAPFLPLDPQVYTEMLGDKIEQYGSKVWLINTGWTGGKYGEGNRISLKYTRAIIQAVLEDKLDNVEYEEHEALGLMMPLHCPGVPAEVLNPRKTWKNKEAYDIQVQSLKKMMENR